MTRRRLFLCFLALLLFVDRSFAGQPHILFCGKVDNDLYLLLKKEGLALKRFDDPAAGIKAGVQGDALFLVADGYPERTTAVSIDLLAQAKKKGLKIYLEYPSVIPGLTINKEPVRTQLERGVVIRPVFGTLKPMSILGINDCFILDVPAQDPLIVLAKVAGFDRAEYGVSDVKTYPLLFHKDGMLVTTTKISSFATGRYGPNDSWKQVWRYILSWATGRNLSFKNWPSFVDPMYGKNQPLPQNAKLLSIEKGVNWFYNGRFFVHPSWKDRWLKYQSDGTSPLGPAVPQSYPNGDGTMGLLEGHASRIDNKGRQQYRYWMRADVQGEAAFALAAAGNLLGKNEYKEKAANLINFVFSGSNLRAENRNDKNSPTYGLIGWAVTHPHVYYGDDNARAILGILGASAYLQTNEWDQQVVEAILANFRTTGKNGFRTDRLEDPEIQKLGWKHFWNQDVVNPAPHFESWMWALYLWLYEKSGYQPLLEKTKTAIRMTMEAYPDKWIWTNGIQQERARMILPLAWLVRVEDTPEHRQWLDMLVQKILENQDSSGAIREELGGAGKGKFGRTASNKEYGLHEAPLIFTNGDPVADMLYTSNFAFFSLNEAAHATGNAQYKKAVSKLGEFLTRIQVRSDKFKDLDGAWFRAFDYNRWEYWASNADVGWGAWGTLTGWTQSWIVNTQVLQAQNQNYWELTRKAGVKKQAESTITLMFGDAVK